MTFIQIIELRTGDIDGVRQLAQDYRQATEGKNTIRREILTQDRSDPRHYYNLVFFDSYQSAMHNNSLPETQAGAGQFRALMDGPPVFHDLTVIDDQQ
jgi:quinol monooxygenase YgiN